MLLDARHYFFFTAVNITNHSHSTTALKSIACDRENPWRTDTSANRQYWFIFTHQKQMIFFYWTRTSQRFPSHKAVAILPKIAIWLIQFGRRRPIILIMHAILINHGTAERKTQHIRSGQVLPLCPAESKYVTSDLWHHVRFFPYAFWPWCLWPLYYLYSKNICYFSVACDWAKINLRDGILFHQK